ncbi:hypothetical protein [Nocardia sp. CC227C]|nr:hypothetical protein [Nocardia sp. CC227C]
MIALSALRARVRHWLDRHRTAVRERSRPVADGGPPAVFSASIGYHPPHR